MVAAELGVYGILINKRFVGMTFDRCEEKLFYHRRLGDAIDVKMDGSEENPRVRCWFFNKLYTNLDHMHRDTHQTMSLDLMISQSTAVRNSIFTERHNLYLQCFRSKAAHLAASLSNLAIHYEKL